MDSIRILHSFFRRMLCLSILVHAVLLVLLAMPLRAERLFVSILETDSVTHARYSTTSFRRSAEIPTVEEAVEETLRKNIIVPFSAWLAPNKPIRIVTTIDSDKPLSGENPSTLVLAPMIDTGDRALAACSSIYSRKLPLSLYGNLFEQPSGTNFPARLAVAREGRYLLISPSRDALEWGWRYRERFIDAPAQTLPGTFRMLVNAQRFADLLPILHPDIARYAIAEKFLRNFATVVLSITMNREVFGFAMRGKPLADTDLAKLAAAWRVPPDSLWNSLPEDALFSSLADSHPATFLDAYTSEPYTSLLAPFRRQISSAGFKGPVFSFLRPTPDRKGLLLAVFTQLENSEAADRALPKLALSQEKSDPVEWVHLPPRKAGDLSVERYSLSLRAGKINDKAESGENALAKTILSMFLRKACLEAAVRNNTLVTVIGPDQPLIEEALPALQGYGAMQTLKTMLPVIDPCLSTGKLLSSISLQASRLLLQAVAIIPDIRQEQLAAFPPSGDGARAGIAREEDGALTFSLRITNSEIASLQRINVDARPMLQEIFFQMFARQMQTIKEQK